MEMYIFQLFEEVCSTNAESHPTIDNGELSELSVDDGSDQTAMAATQVTETVGMLRAELQQKNRTVETLQDLLKQQREITQNISRDAAEELKQRVQHETQQYAAAVQRHQEFIKKLISDKKTLGERYEVVVLELKTIEEKFKKRMKVSEERHLVEIKKAKDMQTAVEKRQREKWIGEQKKKIKDKALAGVEPRLEEISRAHEAQVQKLQSLHQAELERCRKEAVILTEQRFSQMREEMEREMEEVCMHEAELARCRMERQLEEEAIKFQTMRNRMEAEVQEQKDTLARERATLKTEHATQMAELKRQKEWEVEDVRQSCEGKQKQLEKKHQTELQLLHETAEAEQRLWKEKYAKEQAVLFTHHQAEIRRQFKEERDREIESVIQHLEEEVAMMKSENEKMMMNMIRRSEEKFRSEISELEKEGRATMEKCTDLRAKLAESQEKVFQMELDLRRSETELKQLHESLDLCNTSKQSEINSVHQEHATKVEEYRMVNENLKLHLAELRAKNQARVDHLQQKLEEKEKANAAIVEDLTIKVKAVVAKKDEIIAALQHKLDAAIHRAAYMEGLFEKQKRLLMD